MICDFRSCCTYFYLLMMICTVLSVSVNDFYWFGVENGDTARGNESDVVLFFSNFSIANLRNSENATATFLKIHFRTILELSTNGPFLTAISPVGNHRGSKPSGDVFYRITDNTTLLDRATEDIKQSNLTQCDFNPRHLIIITWENFFYGYSIMPVLGNTYQVIITTDGTSTFVIFLFGVINYKFLTDNHQIVFVNLEKNNIVLEYMNLPYAYDITQAPNLMLNSNVPGTYILKLSADVPCSQSPSCPVKGTRECKKNLARLACQKMINDNINPVPKACDSL